MDISFIEQLHTQLRSSYYHYFVIVVNHESLVHKAKRNSNAFTSASKKLDPVPQFKATTELRGFLAQLPN
jgi:hypothetical protein